MRIEEAKYIGDLVKRFTDNKEVRLLNVGSSSEDFRKKIGPYIDEEIFAPIKKLNVKVTHFDLKDEEGVDIAGDIFDSAIQEKLKNLRPNLILACNLLEHLKQDMREQFPSIIDRIIGGNGIIIITVPHSYPLHLDPIDTYYRPSLEDLDLLFPEYDLIDSSIIVSSNYFSEFQALNLFAKLKIIVRIFTPFYKPKTWLCIMHRLFWLFRPYLVSCVALQK
jgi:hypothetical protein